jgi:hypothetical protein
MKSLPELEEDEAHRFHKVEATQPLRPSTMASPAGGSDSWRICHREASLDQKDCGGRVLRSRRG